MQRATASPSGGQLSHGAVYTGSSASSITCSPLRLTEMSIDRGFPLRASAVTVALERERIDSTASQLPRCWLPANSVMWVLSQLKVQR